MSSLKTTHRWAVAQQNPELEKELSAGLGIPGLVARIMVAHGIGSIKEGQLFLTPSLDRDWADPLIIPGMSVVADRVESTAELVRKLSADGIKVNVTTIFTPKQVDEMVGAVDAETPSIISLFAGRIADTGVDPIPFMTESVKKAAAKPNCEVLWASTRELINIYQAEACGCQIITVPNSILAKRKNIGRDPYEVSLDTVRGFAKDIAALGFHILP